MWVTYTDGGGSWTSLDLAQCVVPLPAACGTTTDSRLWKGRLTSAPGVLQYVVQAASGTGLVSLDDNRGAYYGFNGSSQASAAPVPTTLALISAPSSATFGDTTSITAELRSAGAPVAGGIVTIAIGGAAKVGTTDANGRVTLNVPVTLVPGGYQIVASFVGNATLLASSASSAFTVGKATASMTPFAAPAAGATLVATIGGGTQQPLLQEAVTFSLSGPGGAKTVVVTTDYLGRATLSAAALPAGTYTGTASFAGNATYAAASASVSFIVKAAQSINAPLATTPVSPVYAANGTFTVTATSGLPVKITSQSTTICTTGGTNGTTVTTLAPGSCMLAADQAGDRNYFPASQVIQAVTIDKGLQAITFTGPGNQTFGTPPLTLVATASSGLPVTFAATGNCTVSGPLGATLALPSTGSCTITASQAGNGTWKAATDVVRTIFIDLANVWTPAAGKMTTPRSHHTATRFESGPLAGWVLIVGGVDSGGKSLSSAELYNPGTRTFVATDKLHGKSSDHTATLLQDGRVLVVGGGNASADMYDPVTKTWSSAGGTGSNRSLHTATRLPDGRVLIVGGADNGGKTLNTTIVYNPAGGGSFTSGPTMDTARERHTATLLTSGPYKDKVLIVGGRYSSGKSYVANATYQVCDATACTAWKGGINARYQHGAVALVAQDGTQKVLVAGGTDGSAPLANADIYDVGTDSWNRPVDVPLGTLTPGRKALMLSRLPNGRALAAGGTGKPTPSSNATPQAAADVFAPPLAAAAAMGVTRSWHAATPLTDAAGNIVGVLVTGGKTGNAASGDDDDSNLPSVDSAETYGMR